MGMAKEGQKWHRRLQQHLQPKLAEAFFTVLQCMLGVLSSLYRPHQLRVLWFEKLAAAAV